MRILLYILILIVSNVPLLGSEQNIEYMKDTCNRTFEKEYLSTDEERKQCKECSLSRWEVYDQIAKNYVAHIAYDPSRCFISYLRVDKKYRKTGIGKELANRAIEDMRANHGCGDISLDSVYSARRFWKKLGAKRRSGLTYVFRGDPSSNNINS